MYTPNNACVYLKAFAGCLSGLGSSGPLSAVQGNYTPYARMADAYAQSLDTQWGVSAPTGFEEDAILEASEAIWYSRSPLGDDVAFIPGAYTAMVLSVIARVKSGNTQIVLEGVDPNGCTPAAPTLAGIQLVNDDFIPGPDGDAAFDIAVGGAGFSSPATVTSATGRVRVFVAAMIDADPANNIQAYAIRDGVRLGTMLYVVPVVTYFSGQNTAPVVVEFLDTVTPGSAHTWGIHVAVQHGNTRGNGIVNADRAQIIVEDR